jgi:hypothetical protein
LIPPTVLTFFQVKEYLANPEAFAAAAAPAAAASAADSAPAKAEEKEEENEDSDEDMVSLPKAGLFVYLVLTFACTRASVSSTDCCVGYVSHSSLYPKIYTAYSLDQKGDKLGLMFEKWGGD